MPRIGKDVETSRLNLEINVAVREALERLRDETHADSLTEVIRRALAVYDLLWSQKQKGAAIILRDGRAERELMLV